MRRSECCLARGCGRVGCLVIVVLIRSDWAQFFVAPGDDSKPTPKENKNRAAKQATMREKPELYSRVQRPHGEG